MNPKQLLGIGILAVASVPAYWTIDAVVNRNQVVANLKEAERERKYLQDLAPKLEGAKSALKENNKQLISSYAQEEARHIPAYISPEIEKQYLQSLVNVWQEQLRRQAR